MAAETGSFAAGKIYEMEGVNFTPEELSAEAIEVTWSEIDNPDKQRELPVGGEQRT